MINRITQAFKRSSDHLCLYGQSPSYCIQIARKCCAYARGDRVLRHTSLELGGGVQCPARVCLGYTELNMEGMQPRTWTYLVRRWKDASSPQEVVLLKALDKCPLETRRRVVLFLGAAHSTEMARFVATCWHPDAVHEGLRSVSVCISLCIFRTGHDVRLARERLDEEICFGHLPQAVLGIMHKNARRYDRNDVRRISRLVTSCSKACGTPWDHLEVLRGCLDT